MKNSLFRRNTLIGVGAACLIALGATGANAAGDAAKGAKVFKKCKVCHSLKAGKNGQGPSLHGIFGRTSGTLEGFKYSKAMAGAKIVWNEETLDQYIQNPKKFVHKNKMAFPGIKVRKKYADNAEKKAKKAQQRADLIAYLKENTK